MNGGKLTASAPVSHSPALTVTINGTLEVLAGAMMQGNWLHIMAFNINIEPSGLISADSQGYGPRTGPGSSSGEIYLNESGENNF